MVTQSQHRANAKKYIDNQNKANAKQKGDRDAVLSSVKENIVEKTIHKIEEEIELKRKTVPRQCFSGFTCPWKK